MREVDAVESQYEERCARFAALRDEYQRRSNLNGNVSLALFLMAVAALAFAPLRGLAALYGLSALLAVLFIISLVRHDRVNRRLRRYAELFNINRAGQGRLRREWSVVPLPGDAGASARGQDSLARLRRMLGLDRKDGAALLPGMPTTDDPAAIDAATAADLDLFGHASLEHLLATPKTPVGRTVLQDWILHPADAGTVRIRQGAAAELGPDVDFRDEVCLAAQLMGSERTDVERFLSWAESTSWTARHTALLWLARLTPVLLLALGAAQLLGQRTLPAIIGVGVINAVVLGVVGREVEAEISRVATQQSVFEAYAGIIELFTGRPVTSPGLAEVQQRMSSAASISADRQIRRLARLMPLAEFRRWMFFIFVDIATLWSLHTLWLLERWKQANGAAVRGWLAALGEAEAIVAVAAVHHDHPRWAFPEIVERGTPVLAAADLAHPLLPPSEAVGNDVTVGPPGTFLLVTGSNMSGKSTLLRAIGVNAVLAQMGGPVAAARMTLPPLTVTSAMRVQDSLEQGISYFMAELRRLKAIVDRADQQGDQTPRALLYLLDEILQGTNTTERQIAARHIIVHLLRTRAIGVVSTHDLTLAAAPDLAQQAALVHFQETFAEGPEGKMMSFDYRLRPGLASSTNALKLMDLVGLPLDE